MLSIFKPAAHAKRLPDAQVDPTYRRLRWQIFMGIFFGYAAYYLVRKNFTLAMPYLIEQGFSRGIWALPFPGFQSRTVSRNSLWVPSLTARTRAYSCLPV